MGSFFKHRITSNTVVEDKKYTLYILNINIKMLNSVKLG
jgi:hypothetical protein